MCIIISANYYLYIIIGDNCYPALLFVVNLHCVFVCKITKKNLLTGFDEICNKSVMLFKPEL